MGRRERSVDSPRAHLGPIHRGIKRGEARDLREQVQVILLAKLPGRVEAGPGEEGLDLAEVPKQIPLPRTVGDKTLLPSGLLGHRCR